MKSLIALIALLATSAAQAQPQGMRCTVNMNGTNLNDPTGWEAAPIIDARCRPNESAEFPDTRACYAEIVRRSGQAPRYVSWWLREPLAVGQPEPNWWNDYPPPVLPLSAMWPRETVKYEGRIYPDIRRLDVRAKFVGLLATEIKRNPPGYILHDNIPHPGAAGTNPPSEASPAGEYKSPFSWEVLCAYLRDLQAALPAGYTVIPNVGGYAFYWPKAEIDVLARSVRGVAFETPVHPRCRTNQTVMEAQIAAYRAWLDAGLTVVWMDINKAYGAQTPQTRVQESCYNAALAYMIQTPLVGEKTSPGRLWVQWIPDYPTSMTAAAGVSPHWEHWPVLLGEATGPLVVAMDGSNVVVSREFEGGSLKATGPQSVQVSWK